MSVQRVLCAFVLLAIAGIGLKANAATIDYVDVDAETMMFTNISEDTTTDGPLFGQPVSGGGDRMDFNPTEFKAETDGGSEIVDSQLSFTVMSKENEFISEITLTEAGDYALAGLGDATALAQVSANVFWEVVEVDGVGIAPILGSDKIVYEPSDGDYELGVDPNVASFTGHLPVDVAGFLAAEGVAGNATKVEFTLDNTLLVSASNGGSSFIAKKDFDGLVINIPEPSTALLLGFGLAGLAAVRRRRR